MKAWSNIQNFDNISFDDLDLLCSRFDVDSRIYLIYPKGLRHRPPATEIEVTPSYYIKFALLILDQLESNFDWKFANTLLKLSYSGKLQEKSEEYSKLAHRIVDKQPIKPLSRTKKVLFRDFETKDAPVSVPFTLLLADHAVSFAYLWAMRAYGFQPAQIIMFRNEVSARRMFLWKTAYTFDRWVRVSKYFPNNQITSLIGARFAVNDLFPLRTLRTAHTGSINDLALQELLTSSVPEKIIFSGGGVISRETFVKTKKNFLHFHPGVLPGIRGADGLLWSALLRQKAGISGFWMREGLDTGPPFQVQEYSFPIFQKELTRAPAEVVYKSLLTYYDPFLRAHSLIKFLSSESNLKLAENKQKLPSDSRGSRQYHFMHPVLREKVLRLIAGKSFED